MSELNVKTGLDASGFETGIARLQSSAASFARGIGGIFAGAFVFDKLLSGLNQAVQKGDQLQDLANKFGISASQLQLLGNAAELSGASLESVAAAMNKAAINASRAATDQAMAENFERIGLSLEQLRAASPQDILMAFAQAAQQGALGADEFRIAQELMGRSATDLLPTLRMGSDEIMKLGAAMGTYTDSQIKALSAASDAMKTIGNAMTLVFGRIAAAIVPAAAAMAKFLGFENLAGILTSEPPTAVPRQQEAVARTDAAEKAAQIYERADRAARQNFLNSLNDADRLVELSREEAAQREKISRMADGPERAQAVLENITLAGQIDSLRRRVQEQITEGMIPGGIAKAIATGGSLQVLADSLQEVGGGGRFAQIGGADSVQRDQLAVLKNIEKNTGKTMAAGVTPEGVQ